MSKIRLTVPSEPRTHRVTAIRRPDGSDLHVEAYAQDLLRDVLDLLADNRGLWDDLQDVIDGPAVTNDPHKVDAPSRDDVLIDAILAALPPAATAIRLYEPEAERLAAALSADTLSEQRSAA